MKIRIEIDGVMYIPSLGGCDNCALLDYCYNNASQKEKYDIEFISLCTSINDTKHNFKIDQPN